MNEKQNAFETHKTIKNNPWYNKNIKQQESTAKQETNESHDNNSQS